VHCQWFISTYTLSQHLWILLTSPALPQPIKVIFIYAHSAIPIIKPSNSRVTSECDMWQTDVPADGPWCSIQPVAAINTDSLGIAAVSQGGSQMLTEADHSAAVQYQDCTISRNADWYQCLPARLSTADLTSADLNMALYVHFHSSVISLTKQNKSIYLTSNTPPVLPNVKLQMPILQMTSYCHTKLFEYLHLIRLSMLFDNDTNISYFIKNEQNKLKAYVWSSLLSSFHKSEALC